jgi:uncharacterized protein
MEKYLWLAAVIAAYPEHKVVGRTRLQKTVRLLQRLGAPMDYEYMLHFYGPYSEGVQADIGLLENFGLVKEELCVTQDNSPYFVLQAIGEATQLAMMDEVRPFLDKIRILSQTDAVILELAATYDAFREMGEDHKTALIRLRRKKGSKCDGDRLNTAMQLLGTLGLDAPKRSIAQSRPTSPSPQR